MVSEVIGYRGRSALREVGKVFGLEPGAGRPPERHGELDQHERGNRKTARPGWSRSQRILVPHASDRLGREPGLSEASIDSRGRLRAPPSALCPEAAPLEPLRSARSNHSPGSRRRHRGALGFFKARCLGRLWHAQQPPSAKAARLHRRSRGFGADSAEGLLQPPESHEV